MQTEVITGCAKNALIHRRKWEIYFLSAHGAWQKFSSICLVAKPTQRQLRRYKRKYINSHKGCLTGVR